MVFAQEIYEFGLYFAKLHSLWYITIDMLTTFGRYGRAGFSESVAGLGLFVFMVIWCVWVPCDECFGQIKEAGLTVCSSTLSGSVVVS